LNLAVLGVVYPVIFISELPDKTMVAALVLAARGRACAVWGGAALAFAVHVAIAVTVGGVLLTLLPHRLLQALVAALFLGGAAWALRGGSAATSAGAPAPAAPASTRRAFLTSFVVVFLAEWGDLTQILTAGFAVRLHAPFSVGLAAGLALWSVAAVAVAVGRPLGQLPAAALRRISGGVLLALAALTAAAAIGG
jgi:putative Ca2+/H+ antiporter (TMEM165/GDT1 family)